MKTKQSFSTLFLLLLISAFTYAILSFTAAVNFYCCCWADSVAFFGLTIFYLNKNVKKAEPLSEWTVVLSLIIGILLLNLPIRIFAWAETMISLPTLIMSIVSIILALLCFKIKKTYSYIIAYLLITLCNSFLLEKFLTV